VGVCSWSWATNMTTILEQMDTMGVKCMQLSLVPWVKPLYGIEYDASLRETFGKGESGDVFLAIGNRIAKGEISVLSTMISFPFDRWGSYQAISNSNGIVCNIATNDAVGEAVSADDPLGLAAWTVCSNLVDQAAAMTAQLGVGYITTEIGYLDKPMMDHGTNANENAVIGLARLYEVHRLCAKHGIRLLFESGQYSGEGTMALIDAYTNRYAGCTFDHGLTVNDIGINYDTANHVIYENDSSTNAFVVMRSRIPQVHVKDTFESRADRVAAGGFAVDVKWGTADVSRKLDTLAFLKAAGFKGNLLVEHEWGNNRVGDINAALKAILLANNDDPNDLWISPAAMTGETAGEKCEAALRAQGFPKTVAGRLADTQLYGGFRGWAEDHELDPDGLVHKSGVILASAYGASAVADPADLRIAVTNLTVSTGGRMEFDIVVEGYDPAMIDENLLKAALGVEGSTELEPGTFSPDALDFEFGEVTDGRLPALVVPREPAPDRFFIRMTAE